MMWLAVFFIVRQSVPTGMRLTASWSVECVSKIWPGF